MSGSITSKENSDDYLGRTNRCSDTASETDSGAAVSRAASSVSGKARRVATWSSLVAAGTGEESDYSTAIKKEVAVLSTRPGTCQVFSLSTRLSG